MFRIGHASSPMPSEIHKVTKKYHKGWSLWGDIEQAFGIDNPHSSFNQQKMAAERSRDFSSREAKKLRDWQEGLSNNAVQRKMADYKKAGINPIMVSQWGGADTPGGGMATTGMEQVSTITNSLLQGMGTAVGIGAMGKRLGSQQRFQKNEGKLNRLHSQQQNQLDRELKAELHRNTLNSQNERLSNWQRFRNVRN